jgi:hypothetical protein
MNAYSHWSVLATSLDACLIRLSTCVLVAHCRLLLKGLLAKVAGWIITLYLNCYKKRKSRRSYSFTTCSNLSPLTFNKYSRMINFTVLRAQALVYLNMVVFQPAESLPWPKCAEPCSACVALLVNEPVLQIMQQRKNRLASLMARISCISSLELLG